MRLTKCFVVWISLLAGCAGSHSLTQVDADQLNFGYLVTGGAEMSVLRAFDDGAQTIVMFGQPLTQEDRQISVELEQGDRAIGHVDGNHVRLRGLHNRFVMHLSAGEVTVQRVGQSRVSQSNSDSPSGLAITFPSETHDTDPTLEEIETNLGWDNVYEEGHDRNASGSQTNLPLSRPDGDVVSRPGPLPSSMQSSEMRERS